MRVLLVEDDAATSASIELMLRKESFICDTTDLGEDGLEIGKLYDYDIIILDLPPWSALEINALQRASTIIVQKSLKEGFGLTVAEGLWKAKPTIASAVGGIPNQIIHKLTGVLVHSVEGCAFQIRYLLTHPEFARSIGVSGREHVKENFLMTTNVKRWLLLFRILQQAKGRLAKAA